MVGGVILFCFMEPQSSLFFLSMFEVIWRIFIDPKIASYRLDHRWTSCNLNAKGSTTVTPQFIGPPGNAPCDQLVAAWGTLWWIRHGLLDNHPGWGWFSTLKTSISSGFPPCPVWWP
jgi:hypothetical protein